jgi:hypothetical protein
MYREAKFREVKLHTVNVNLDPVMWDFGIRVLKTAPKYDTTRLHYNIICWVIEYISKAIVFHWLHSVVPRFSDSFVNYSNYHCRHMLVTLKFLLCSYSVWGLYVFDDISTFPELSCKHIERKKKCVFHVQWKGTLFERAFLNFGLCNRSCVSPNKAWNRNYGRYWMGSMSTEDVVLAIYKI